SHGYKSLHIMRSRMFLVQTPLATARQPFRSSIAAAQSSQFMPRFAGVFRLEQGVIFHSRVNVIGIVERWFQMPDALEFPGMLCAVVPLVGREWLAGSRRCVVNELVALALGHAVGAFYFFATSSRMVHLFVLVIR